MKRATLLLVAMLAALLLAGGAAFAGPLVDPNTLQPPPPDGASAICRDNGQYVICHTVLDYTLVNEPVFELSCGQVYETSFDHREGIRWYSDGLLVNRFVTQDVRGTWSLSRTGAEPTVSFFGHISWWTDYPVPGEDSDVETFHGNNITVQLPGTGGLHVAGIAYPDGTQHGVVRDIDDPAGDAALCAALQP
jgi:hypothetical protein